MRKTVFALLFAMLMSMTGFAEDMPLIEWSTPNPAPTSPPTPTGQTMEEIQAYIAQYFGVSDIGELNPEQLAELGLPSAASQTGPVPSAPETGEIVDSWDEIIAAIDDGTARQRYAVGAYKPLDLGQFGTINMQLAGFDLDTRADGNGKAATTWIAKELLPETHRWNPEWDNDKEGTGTVGGWEKCELRQWMNDNVLPAIPENIRSSIIPVRKKQKACDADWKYFEQITEDRIWIPSREEIFGGQSLYYGMFHDQSQKRAKTQGGSAAWWWLRSANGYDIAYSVYYDGSGNGSYVVNFTSGGVVLGFCL